MVDRFHITKKEQVIIDALVDGHKLYKIKTAKDTIFEIGGNRANRQVVKSLIRKGWVIVADAQLSPRPPFENIRTLYVLVK